MALTVIDKLGRSNVYGEGGHWSTPAMRAGTETVEEHLLDTHFCSPADLQGKSLGELHALHDRYHELNGDAQISALMDLFGF